MESKLMSCEDAWDHFYQALLEELKDGGSGQIPHEVQQAHYARQGKYKAPLGLKRMQRLMEKYFPGRYTVISAVRINSAKM